MNPNRYTQRSVEAIQEAQNSSIRNRNNEIRQSHLLYGLLSQEDGLVPQILTRMNKDPQKMLVQTEQLIMSYPRVTGDINRYIAHTLTMLFSRAEDISKDMGDAYVSVEHLFKAMLEIPDNDVEAIFKQFSIDKGDYNETVGLIRGSAKVMDQNPEMTYNVLQKYGTDLTDLARKNKLEPVIGRDEEIRNTFRILSRKTKNNPVLLGEPGVGKSSIVDALAQRIVSGDVPSNLKNKIVFSLDMGSLIAGAKYRGEFEARLKSVLNEVKKSEGNILLFIDEIHTIVGAGRSEGAMDAGNLLKPMLARGELHCIGATTLDEYRMYIEKDSALERRFQPVMVPEPTQEETIAILRGIKQRYEIFHGVKIHDQALVASAMLSARYISDRFLPDKAIDLMDEACAMIRTEMDSMPTEMDQLNRKVLLLEIEEAALKGETDERSVQRLAEVQKDLENSREKFLGMKSRWDNEKQAINRVQELRERIENTKFEIEKAEREYDLNAAAELKYGTLPNLEKQLVELEAVANKALESDTTLLRDQVTEEEIAKIVARWTGIPISKLMEGEREKLLSLEKILHRRVIGQDEGVSKVSEAILRSRAGIQNPNRPIGSFFFLGPTGVGKTELAKALAQALFDDEKSLVRIDMSEYMEKFSVSRLVGAPPGYVGYEEGGQLTEAVRRKPYSVVLFDEVEKAHQDVFNILLQILDDGRVTDSIGRTVDFKNTIIILTSNLGSPNLLNGIHQNGEIDQTAIDEVDELLRQHFRPEFLNRLDEIIYFKPLVREQYKQIIDLQVGELQERLADKKLKIVLTGEAKDLIMDESYDIAYGARPLRRYLQRTVETQIARMIIADKIKNGDIINVIVENGAIAVKPQAADVQKSAV